MKPTKAQFDTAQRIYDRLGRGSVADIDAIAHALAEAERGTMRTGDVVYHAPSREEWVVAWADYASGYMAPCGWPECQASIADCVVIRRASDDERSRIAADLAKSGRRDANRAAAILSTIPDESE